MYLYILQVSWRQDSRRGILEISVSIVESIFKKDFRVGFPFFNFWFGFLLGWFLLDLLILLSTRFPVTPLLLTLCRGTDLFIRSVWLMVRTLNGCCPHDGLKDGIWRRQCLGYNSPSPNQVIPRVIKALQKMFTEDYFD
jgi:hypothetical protein